MNLDEYQNIETHWIALYSKNNETIYFDSFGIEHIPKEVKVFIGHKILKQIYSDYKHMFQLCVDISVLNLLICRKHIGNIGNIGT